MSVFAMSDHRVRAMLGTEYEKTNHITRLVTALHHIQGRESIETQFTLKRRNET